MPKLTTQYSCAICGKGVEVNSIQCRKSMKLIHKKFSGVKESLAAVETIECNLCKTNQVAADFLKSVNKTGNLIEKVEMFCVQNKNQLP